MDGTRATPSRELLIQLIAEELKTFVPEGDFSAMTSPVFWQKIFVRYFLSEPTGNNDPRWDELFKDGFKIVRQLGS